MNSFKGYVLQAELSEKAKVSNSLFRQLNGLEFKKMGLLTCIKKSSLPCKYKEIAEECIDLEKYWSFSFISKEIGMCEDFMSDLERRKSIISRKIGGVKLFELSSEFCEKLEKGLTPFKIRNKEDSFAEETILMQGLKIGFY